MARLPGGDVLPTLIREAKRAALAGGLLAAAALLAGAAAAAAQSGPVTTFRFGAQRPDLVRFNRVEGLSVGARGQLLLPGAEGATFLTATARLGTEDRVPNGRLDLTRETLGARVSLAAYHELAAVDEGGAPLGLANSLTALVIGRDDGEYYRRAGAEAAWTPPSARPRSFRVSAWLERHLPVAAGAPPAVRGWTDEAWSFRPNLEAEEGWDGGIGATLAPRWGTDPRRLRWGVTARALAGGASWSYRRLEAGATADLPLGGDLRVTGEMEGGTTWGRAPVQRRFLVGGPSTLRGYEPRVMEGPSLLRARGGLARSFAFGQLSLFVDGAWAGHREAFALREVLWSAGVGLAAVDGLIHVDAAWGRSRPRSFRLEIYLDRSH